MLKRIAVIGNYVPRQCGIATFTTDLCESLAAQFPELNCFAIPVNDTENGYVYPPRVRFELREGDLTSYRQAADFLNINRVDLVCLQHEFGIFGGPDGSHILWLVRDLRSPVVTTLHTIPSRPTSAQRKVLLEIAARSDRLVVMSRKGADFLRGLYGVAPEKIDLIPHGIHDVPFTDPNYYKDHFGVEGKFVILSFGLLGRNKGIEDLIRALRLVLIRCPQAVLMVVGATHPNILRTEGESYRLSLQQLAQELGVAQNVIFHNRFVSLEELIEFIGAADLYVTPYLNQDQITSGTLAYALGAGKAVVSTPYWYAEELLADGAGQAGRSHPPHHGRRSGTPRDSQTGLPAGSEHDLAGSRPRVHADFRPGVPRSLRAAAGGIRGENPGGAKSRRTADPQAAAPATTDG
jgi:glycosyltransferase involved in cell wall biosynthesis